MDNNGSNFNFNNDFETGDFFDIFKGNGENSNDATINEARELYATMGLQMEYTDSLKEKRDNRKLAAMQFVEIDEDKSSRITQKLIEVYGQESFQVKKWLEQLQKIKIYKAAQQKAEKKRKRQFIIMCVMCVVSVLLIAGIIFLALNSTTYYVNQGDYGHIYKKTMFGAPQMYCDIPATGLVKQGSDLYFRGKEDDTLYSMSTGNGNVRVLSSNSASEFRYLNNYIYYVNNTDGDKLYRVRADGTGDEEVYDHAVSTLNTKGNDLTFYDERDRRDKILNTNTLAVFED